MQHEELIKRLKNIEAAIIEEANKASETKDATTCNGLMRMLPSIQDAMHRDYVYAHFFYEGILSGFLMRSFNVEMPTS